MLSTLGGWHFLFQAFRALARKSEKQKMTKRSETKRQHFFAGSPQNGSMKLLPTSIPDIYMVGDNTNHREMKVSP
jgi:hypothetical protein